jgi:hypothetical protein
VVVVAHQDVGEKGELEALANPREQAEELVTIVIVEEEVALVAAVACQVVDARLEKARSAWHSAETRPCEAASSALAPKPSRIRRTVGTPTA